MLKSNTDRQRSQQHSHVTVNLIVIALFMGRDHPDITYRDGDTSS